VKYFVMFRESGTERRAMPRSVKISCTGRQGGGVGMPTLLADLLLFSVLAAWVSGMVIAIASLLS